MKKILNLINNIHEYVTNPLIWFKNYLTMSDDEKAMDLVDRNPTQYGYYADETGIELPDDFDADDGEYTFELPKEKQLAYGKWLLDNLDVSDTQDNPSWVYMDYLNIVKNQWLVHSTNDPNGIIKDGFIYGLEDYAQIAYTKHSNPQTIYDPNFAYIFSYTPSDFIKYGRSRYRGMNYKYGDEAVVFRASGVRIHHDGDEENQTIVVAGTARDFVPIFNKGDVEEYYIKSKEKDGTYRPLIYFDSIEKAVSWIMDNFDQYRDRIVQRARN